MASTDEPVADQAAPEETPEERQTRRPRKSAASPDGQPTGGVPRKRATRKKVFDGHGDGGAATPGQDALTPASVEEFDETAMGLVVSEALGLQEAPEEPAAPVEHRSSATPADGDLDEDDADEPEVEGDYADEADVDDAAEASSARPVTSFGLLFQAPELPAAPSRPRRPAQTEAAAPEAADGVSEPDGIPEPEAADAADAADEGDDADAATEETPSTGRRRRRRGGKGRRSRSSEPAGSAPDDTDASATAPDEAPTDDGQSEGEAPAESPATRRRTRRRRRSGASPDGEDTPGVVTKVREPRRDQDEVVGVKGSTRLEAKKQRRREGREAGRRRTIITEAEFLARRESVERVMLVRRVDDRTQIGVLEDGVLVEHYVSRDTNVSMAGNIYLGKVQNVLPSMEAAFVDIGKGRNAVLYAGEVNWDVAGLESGQPKRIENALESGQSVLVQVTKDPIGHKGARLTSQISLPGRYLVYVPDSGMTGISRKLPDTERARLKRILRDVVPETAGVIVRTAAEGASEAELRADVERLTATWEQIRSQVDNAGTSRKSKGGAPVLLHGEPDLTVRVIRDVFNEDFAKLVVSGEAAWAEVNEYVQTVAPDLADRLSHWTSEEDLFSHHRVDEQIAKAMDRKVWLPSGGSLVIDRTEAMTVVDVNTGKFVGSGGNLEETVTRNNIEAAEEIVRQLRLRDIGGIIVIDFIDMVLESNRDLVVRRLLECLGRDRTKHQVAEVTSLGLVQMTRKRVGSGLIEVFSETCEHCNGRGYIVYGQPIDRSAPAESESSGHGHSRASARRSRSSGELVSPPQPPPGGPTPAQIAAAAHAAAIKSSEEPTARQANEGPGAAVAEDRGGEETPAPAPVGEPVAGPEAAVADEPSADPSDEVGAEPVVEAGAQLAAQAVPESDEQPAIEVDAGGQGEGATEPAAEPVGHDGFDTDDDAPEWQQAQIELPHADGPATPQPRRRRHGRVVAPAGPPPTTG